MSENSKMAEDYKNTILKILSTRKKITELEALGKSVKKQEKELRILKVKKEAFEKSNSTFAEDVKKLFGVYKEPLSDREKLQKELFELKNKKPKDSNQQSGSSPVGGEDSGGLLIGITVVLLGWLALKIFGRG